MKKSEFKEMIKESVKEVLVEEGVLKSVISEVVKAVGTLQGDQTIAIKENNFSNEVARKARQSKLEKMKESKKRMLDAIGQSAYGGVDLFEGTTPMKNATSDSSKPSPSSPLEGVDPDDSGVDISSLLGGANAWKQLIK